MSVLNTTTSFDLRDYSTTCRMLKRLVDKNITGDTVDTDDDMISVCWLIHSMDTACGDHFLLYIVPRTSVKY